MSLGALWIALLFAVAGLALLVVRADLLLAYGGYLVYLLLR